MKLLGLDWGTTSLRIYTFNAKGLAVDLKTFPCGVASLMAKGEANFKNYVRIFKECTAGFENIPAIACGTIGSPQGFLDAGYLGLPASLKSLQQAIKPVIDDGKTLLHIIPGLYKNFHQGLNINNLPDLMRGEETQIAGALSLGAVDDEDLIGLPGTHSKWVFLKNGLVDDFYSFMSGEGFAALREHSILKAKLKIDESFNEEAFMLGLNAGIKHHDLGLLNVIFSARTLALSQDSELGADYLFGVLLSYELNALSHILKTKKIQPKSFKLISSQRLKEPYGKALSQFFPGVKVVIIDGATRAGLWGIAKGAGLLA